MGWELETVEKPFVEQLQAMGWRHVEGDFDDPARSGRGSFAEVVQETILLRRLHADAAGPALGWTTNASRRPSAHSHAFRRTG